MQSTPRIYAIAASVNAIVWSSEISDCCYQHECVSLLFMVEPALFDFASFFLHHFVVLLVSFAHILDF